MSRARYAAVENIIPTTILLNSRGLVEAGDGFELSQSSAARADFTAQFYLDHREIIDAQDGCIITPTSYTPLNNYTRDPEAREREGPLNAVRMKAKGVPDDRLVVDNVAVSTLEEVLYVGRWQWRSRRQQVTPENPLGIVNHDGQMDRALWLAGRGLDVPKNALVPLVVPGEDVVSPGISERYMFALSRLAMIGAVSPRAMVRRERMMRRVLSVAGVVAYKLAR